MPKTMTTQEDTQAFEQRVLDKCDYFSSVQLWPTLERLDPEGWLSNFHTNERPYAVHLLNFFTFFSERLVDSLFTSTFHRLSNYYRKKYNASHNWLNSRKTFFTLVTGEIPSLADSGHAFIRKIRDKYKIDESLLISSDDIINRNLNNCNIIFVDDFVGSGSQMKSCANKVVCGASIMSHMRNNKIDSIYCNAVTTKYGLTAIQNEFPDLTIICSHLIGDEYSVFGKNSLCWSGHTQTQGIGIIKAASIRAGIPQTLGDVASWTGFHRLGLALSFHHSTPDATLPIFTYDENGWIPLIRK